jgi:hypothetical protein
MRPRAAVVACFLGMPVRAFGAPAEPDVAFSVRYDPPAGCPSAADFEGAIVSRTPGASVAPPGAAPVAFDVELLSSRGEVAAVLVTTLPDGTRSRRDVTAESCEEAVTALAVIAALAVNGYREAKSSPVAPAEPSAPPARSEPPVGKSAAPPDEPPERERVDGESAPRASAPRAATLRPGAFVHATWESAVAPSGTFGANAGAELEWGRSGVWWPSVRAGVLATLAGSETTSDGSATFRVIAARVELCPVGWGERRAPSLRACLELDAGKLDGAGSGDGIRDPQTQSMPWLAAGAAGRGEWPLAAWLSLEASAGARALLRHDVFLFRPGTVVHDVPPISAGFALGIVGRMP